MHILFEDNHLLAVIKPPGLVTMGVKEGEPSLLALAREYIKHKYQKPGNVYLGAMSRLDAPVSGVMLFARTSKAAARLTEQFKSRTVDKTYWAIVEGNTPPEGHCVDWLAEDERHRKMHIVRPDTSGAREAKLSFRLLERLKQGSLLEIQLETGRKHQIRLQMAHLGHAVLGDRKYGARLGFPEGIALHARRLIVEHPVKPGTRVELVAPLPAVWRRYGVQS